MLNRFLVMPISWCLLFFMFGASASDINPTKITRVLVGPGYGNRVILSVSPRPPNLPACQTNPGYSFAFDGTSETGKMTLSLVLTAYAAGKPVWIGGTDVCDVYPGIESLRHIVLF